MAKTMSEISGWSIWYQKPSFGALIFDSFVQHSDTAQNRARELLKSGCIFVLVTQTTQFSVTGDLVK
jgi:hypothetical protein